MKFLFKSLGKRRIITLFGLGVLVVGIVLRFLVPPDGVADVEGSARVLDGDSLVVAGREVRMQGIDAPEGRQKCRRGGDEWACGQEARRLLRRLIGRSPVTCKGLDIDKHDRLLALCRTDRFDLNREMVAQGYAVAYGRFEAEEHKAKKNKKGMWTGEFELPRDWRRRRNIGR